VFNHALSLGCLSTLCALSGRGHEILLRQSSYRDELCAGGLAGTRFIGSFMTHLV
jgi:hypothetical protein